jgi:xylulose-5-phosphate/fructose-6-phosphate phosphoketolase
MYARANHANFHVHGYKEEGTITTPFNMVVMNELDRFHLVANLIDRVPWIGPRAQQIKAAFRDKLIEHKKYTEDFGQDMPEIQNWRWGEGQ